MQIEIKNLVVEACHGVFEEEKRNAQPFVFTVEMETPFSSKDDISGTVNYAEAMELIVSFTKSKCFDLIETLSDEVAKEILKAFPLVKSVSVRVEKPKAPVSLPFETVAVTAKRAWTKAYVAFGSSLGDKKATIDKAIERLKQDLRVKKVSSYLETEPYGGVAKEQFLNGAMEVETYLFPEELLALLNQVEAEFLRTREVHWGDRTLDLDILLYGEEVIETEKLTIPHKEMLKRDFVLDPLKEIAPYAYHPLERKIIKDVKKMV